jgi:hypothetical protein
VTVNLRNTDLSSPRLSLKAFVAEDAREVFDAVTPSLTRFMSFEPSPSLDVLDRKWFEAAKEPELLQLLGPEIPRPPRSSGPER